jgi:hypothetical protein
MNNNILILDDEEQFQSDHRRKLREEPATKGFELPEVSVEAFAKDLLVLLDRAKHGGQANEEKRTCFDAAAILFVDYRLIDLKLEGFFTGELVAYLARCFSDCGVIVGVNQFGDRVFDLSLCGHPTSFADINIGADDIENTGLWRDEWTGFRPWHWPLLSQEAQKLEKRVAELSNLDAPVFEFIGLTSLQVGALPRSVLEFVTNRTSAEAHQTTIREFIVESGNGLNRKEKTSEKFERRVAAARLSKWIERFLLGGQNTLVDAPHLVTRFPSLLEAALDSEGLDKTASLRSTEALPLKSTLIAKHEFQKSNWISRPAWFWDSLKDDNAVDEVREPWNRIDVPFRFCEDTSRFNPQETCKEFVADLPSPFTRRYVQRLSDVNYVPELRFSM